MLPMPDVETKEPVRRGQLLKWIGNKQRFAPQIVPAFPKDYGSYFEPFLGGGAVLAELRPRRAMGSDTFAPLVGIWKALHDHPDILKGWYASRYAAMMSAPDKVTGYKEIKASYNRKPNAADLVFLSRSCYGGVVRFRKRDGHMSTPCGAHKPISPASFSARVDDWHARTKGALFTHCDYRQAFAMAEKGDIIYCDPPYSYSQTILYGAQDFCLEELLELVALVKEKGVRVALSIDGTKKNGSVACDLPIPGGLFEREVAVDCGRSMLKRFQMSGKTLEEEHVSDRLLLTY